MHAVHVIPSLEPETGGPAQSVPALCRALRGNDIEISLCTFRRPGGIAVELPNQDFSLRHFEPLWGSRQLPTREFYKTFRHCLRDADIVHLHSLWNPCISTAAFACRQEQIPYVISPRGMLQQTSLRRRAAIKRMYRQVCERRTIAGAAALHFLSDTEAIDSRPAFPNGTPTFVIPNGIEAGLAQAIEPGRFIATYPSLRGKKIVLFVGRMHWSKGLELQLAAMDIVARDNPDCVWVMIGPDGGEASAIQNQARQKLLDQHFLYTGMLAHRQVLEALRDAAVFLLTSRNEAHSMAMNEALAVGVPMVLTETVGFHAIASAGAGYSVPANPPAIAKAICELLSDRNQAARMASRGQRYAADQLNWNTIARAMTARYEQILAQQRLGTKPMAQHG